MEAVDFKLKSNKVYTDRRGKKFLIGNLENYYKTDCFVYAPNVVELFANNVSEIYINRKFQASKFSYLKTGTKFIAFVSECLLGEKISSNVINVSPPVLALVEDEKKIIKYPLKNCRYTDYSICLPSDGSNKIVLYACIYKSDFPDFPYSKLLERIKKVFSGDIEVTFQNKEHKSYGGSYKRWEIVDVSFEDGLLNRLKKMFIEYKVNLELKRLIRAAKVRKTFHNKQTLVSSLRSKCPTADTKTIGDLVEKKFNRDKYEYKCFELLKNWATTDENIFVSTEGFVFNINEGIYNWWVLETPGKTAATYIFESSENISEFLGQLAITPKCTVIADKEVQKKLKFVVRIVHRNFEQWKSHTTKILCQKIPLSAFDSEGMMKMAERVKTMDNQKRANEKIS